ncbi:MAG: metal ABC transporter permease, partial [Acetobacteraceae bacterium]|nr:metal ABC transporter permease [Acetobacteraceae bacterium]
AGIGKGTEAARVSNAADLAQAALLGREIQLLDDDRHVQMVHLLDECARHVMHAGQTLAVRLAAAIAVFASIIGLLLSFHTDLPAGPAIVLSAGGRCGLP